jgi:hypothetical protein
MIKSKKSSVVRLSDQANESLNDMLKDVLAQRLCPSLISQRLCPIQ